MRPIASYTRGLLVGAALSLGAALGLACSGGPVSSTSDSEATGHDTHDHDTHDHEHTTAHDHDTHDHEHTTAHGGDETSEGTSDDGTTGAIESSPEGYCFCMLEFCHDEYHATWGDDHVDSEMMCLAEAGALPSVGMDVDAGNSLECRLHHCLEAMASGDTSSSCPSALGMDACQ